MTGKDRHWKVINEAKLWRRSRPKLGCRTKERERAVQLEPLILSLQT
jgi:hypothetical protein